MNYRNDPFKCVILLGKHLLPTVVGVSTKLLFKQQKEKYLDTTPKLSLEKRQGPGRFVVQ